MATLSPKTKLIALREFEATDKPGYSGKSVKIPAGKEFLFGGYRGFDADDELTIDGKPFYVGFCTLQDIAGGYGAPRIGRI